jgi:hypothetical protein
MLVAGVVRFQILDWHFIDELGELKRPLLSHNQNRQSKILTLLKGDVWNTSQKPQLKRSMPEKF